MSLKVNKPKRNQLFSEDNKKAPADSKVSLLEVHLNTVFDRGVNLKTRTIQLSGDIDSDTFKLIDSGISEMEHESKKAITIKINSTGGSPYDAMAIVGRIKESKCQIITKGYGAIMSAASIVLASGNKRYVSRYAWFMHHESQYDVGENGHHKIKEYVQQMEREERFWSKCMAELTLETEEFWYSAGQNKDTYFLAEKLLELGVVDEIF